MLGNITLVTDTKGNKTEMKYDSLGRKRYMSDPDMGVWRYTYDANGNLETQTDANGQIISFTYDKLNRLETKKHGTKVVLTNTYDEIAAGYFNKGRLTKMVYPSGTPATPNNQTVYNYDNMANIASTTKTIDGTEYALSYTYLNGRLGSITYPGPNAETVNYTYDTGYLKGVTGYVAYSEFNALGKPKNAAYGNQTSTLLEYDPITKRLSELSLLGSGNQGLLIDNTYGYDNKGNITSITDNLNKPLPTNLTSETYVPHANHPHAVGSTGSGKAFTYDDNGNVKNDGQRAIIYDYDNMPTTVKNDTYTYDGTGTRVKRTTSSGTFVYIDKLYECAIGSACTKFIFAGSNRIALKNGSLTLYYHPDHQGSTSVVTDATGNRIEDIAYNPFGGTRKESCFTTANHIYTPLEQEACNTPVDHMYTSQELDYETGLYNYNARLYDPDLGRFMTPDSIVPDYTNPQSLNRYSYAINNPMRYVDPTGHDYEEEYQYWNGGAGSYGSISSAPSNLSYNLKPIVDNFISFFTPGSSLFQNATSDFNTGNYLGAAIKGVGSLAESGLFLASFGDSSILSKIATTAVDEFASLKTTGAIQKYFPDNNGFFGSTERKFLMPGDQIDRFGGSDYSRFFSPAGTLPEMRSLPANSVGASLRTFQVLKPFEVKAGTVAPAFGQPGMGTQFMTPVQLRTLLDRAILGEITH